MTMKVSVKDEYLEQFEDLLKTLPKDAVEVKKSLDEEIDNCRKNTVKEPNQIHMIIWFEMIQDILMKINQKQTPKSFSK